MIIAIFSHTPLWVWAILAFLLYRGWMAGQDREVSRNQLFIVPAIFLALSLDGIGRGFGWHGSTACAWLVGAALGTAGAWFSANPDRFILRGDGHTVFVRGSWAPLAIMLAIFLTKYVSGVLLALEPARAQHLGFAVGVCGWYGVCNGLFLAQLLRLLRLQPARGI